MHNTYIWSPKNKSDFKKRLYILLTVILAFSCNEDTKNESQGVSILAHQEIQRTRIAVPRLSL